MTIEGFPEEPPGAVLTDVQIRRLVAEVGLITEFDDDSLQGASYDMRVGEECFVGGHTRVLTKDSPSYRLMPGEFILLTSFEHLKVPDDLVGHAGLMSEWAQRGLISLFSPQIDPGFQGLIVVPLVNVGNAPVPLKLKQRMFTVEFVRTTKCASESWTKRNTVLEGIQAPAEIQMARPDLSDIVDRIAKLESEVATVQATQVGYERGVGRRVGSSSLRGMWIGVIIGVLGLVAAILALVLG